MAAILVIIGRYMYVLALGLCPLCLHVQGMSCVHDVGV